MSVTRTYILAAGGTGGHMMPASALATELVARGHTVALITDARGAKIPGLCSDMAVHLIPAGRITKNPLSWPGGARAILAGRLQSMRLYKQLQPSAVIGFGGYPAFPALIAAIGMRITTAVHEQNAVLGRVNRQVARKVAAIVTAYPQIQRMPKAALGKVHLLGNPVRTEVEVLRDNSYASQDSDGRINILVTGGSQGASILSQIVPDGLAALPAPIKTQLNIVQQCRENELADVQARYAAQGLNAMLLPYITDMPAQLAKAQVVIARAGASTIAELTCAGRPAILIPLPSAMDDHQTFNAQGMTAAGGARTIVQSDFTPEALAQNLLELGLGSDELKKAAAAAKSCGHPHATQVLANLIERLSPTPRMETLTRKPARIQAHPQTKGAFA